MVGTHQPSPIRFSELGVFWGKQFDPVVVHRDRDGTRGLRGQAVREQCAKPFVDQPTLQGEEERVVAVA